MVRYKSPCNLFTCPKRVPADSPAIFWKNHQQAEKLLGNPNFHLALWDWVRSRSGYVYVMTMAEGDHMSKWIKIGHTRNDPFLRAKELGHAGSIHEFDVVMAYPFADRYWAEHNAHEMLKGCRGRGELFETTLDLARECLASCQEKERSFFSRYVDYDALVCGDKTDWLARGVDMDRWVQDFS